LQETPNPIINCRVTHLPGLVVTHVPVHTEVNSRPGHRGQSTILDKVRLSKGEFEWLGDGRKNDSAGEFNAQCGPGHGVEAEEERGKLSRIVD
jgi:hypothetical protein